MNFEPLVISPNMTTPVKAVRAPKPSKKDKLVKKRQVKRYTEEERRYHKETFLESKMSIKEYSQRMGVNATTLWGWLKNDNTGLSRPAAKEAAHNNAHPDVITTNKTPENWVIKLCDGVEIVVSSGSDITRLVNLIKGLM